MRRLVRNEALALMGRRLAGPLFLESARTPVGVPLNRAAAAGPDIAPTSGPALSSSQSASSSRRADKAGAAPPPSIPAADSVLGDSVLSSPQEPARPNAGAGACTAPPGAGHCPDIEAGGAVILSAQVAALLALVAAHDRVSPQRAIAQLVCARAEAIGLGPLLDAVDDAAFGAAGHGESEREILP